MCRSVSSMSIGLSSYLKMNRSCQVPDGADTEIVVNSRQSEKLIHTSPDKQGSKSGIKGNMRGTSSNSESRVFKLVTKQGKLGTKKQDATQLKGGIGHTQVKHMGLIREEGN